MALPNASKRKIFDDRYEILSIVGRGEDSVVYHARHISGSAQDVALKVLVKRKDDANLSDKLRKEALTLVSCRNKYVVRLDDFHSVDDICYLSMEYAPYGDLTKYTHNKRERIPSSQVIVFLKQCLEALDFIHATGVIHRDIKPENILVVSESEIRMADFGLALLPGDDVNIDELKRGVGTLAYLPPETLQGITYDARSDLYSLGLSFIEILIGSNPYTSIPLAEQLEARKNLQEVKVRLESVSTPVHIGSLLLKLVAFDPEDRFMSALEALRAIEDPTFRFDVMSSNIDTTETPVRSQAETINIPEHISSQSHPHAQIANNDKPEKPVAQSTERIDLDRIKSLIKQKSTTPNQQNQRTSKPPTQNSASKAQTAPASAQKGVQNTPSVAKRQNTRSTNFKVQSTLKTFVAITVGFALITVLVLLVVKFLFTDESPKPSVTPQNAIKATDNPVVPQKVAPALKSLSHGIHSGLVRGLLPQGDVPLAFISNPTKHTITLLFGVPGWLPTEISTSTPSGSPSQEYIFRSNGLILKFNQEMPSATITGTVTDIVTGTTGSWVINQP